MAEKKDRGASGAAIAGGGAVTAGTGLVAGGVPGAKSNPAIIQPGAMKEGRGKGVRRRLSFARQNAGGGAKAGRAGVLGFRTEVHRGGLYDFTEKAKHKAAQTPAAGKEASHAFSHGYVHGKIAPEEKIIRQMKGGKKVAGAALVGGTAMTAYGLHRSRQEKVHKAEKHSDRYHGTLAGVGGGGLAVSAGAHKLLRGQEKSWRTRANRSVDTAQKLVPSLGGRKPDTDMRRYKKHLARGGTPENFPKTMHPERHIGEIARDKDAFKGVSPGRARRAGQLRGGAAQAQHFSEVYGGTAKLVGRFRTPSAIVAGAGVGGLAASKMKHKGEVKKMSMDEIAKLEWSPTASKKQKAGYTAAALPTIAASGVGGGLMGSALGEHAAEHGWKQGAKLAAKSTHGKVGAGLAVAGIGGAAGAQAVGRRKGILITNKQGRALKQKGALGKRHTVSAFGVDHGA